MRANENHEGPATAPDIAVVLPCYNPGAELAWTLESLRAQTVPFKLFVVDDGSARKPDYKSVLADFADVEIIELTRNEGPCTFRNHAMARALEQGYEFVALMDLGDWAFPDRLDLQRKFLRAHGEVGLVGCDVAILDTQKCHVYDFRPPRSDEEIGTYLFYGLAFKHPAIMFRAAVLEETGLYSGEFDAAEDYEIVRRVAGVTKLANIPRVLMKVVEYDTGVSATRRFSQLLSRLRIQWRHRALMSLHFWLGIAKTVVALIAPVRLINAVKPLMYRLISRHTVRPNTVHGANG